MIKFKRCAAFFTQGQAEGSRAGSGIKDQEPVVTPHLDARSIAAIALRFRTGASNRASNAPESYAEIIFHGHNKLNSDRSTISPNTLI